MANIAHTYSALGRHSEALAMFETVLEFFDRVPPDLPDMGEGHKIYPPLYENVLELRRRVLPADHPDIAMACHNLSHSYHINMLNHKKHGLDKLPRALELAREALRIWQLTLPPGHNNISVAKKHVSQLKSMNGHGFRDMYQALQVVDVMVRDMLLPDLAAGNTTHSAIQHNFRQAISSNQADLPTLDQLAKSLGLASVSNDTRRKITREGDVKGMDSLLSGNEGDSKDSGPASGCSCEEQEEDEKEEEGEEQDSRIWPCLHQ